MLISLTWCGSLENSAAKARRRSRHSHWASSRITSSRPDVWRLCWEQAETVARASRPWTFEGHLREHGRDARATQHVVPPVDVRGTLARTRAGRPCHSTCRPTRGRSRDTCENTGGTPVPLNMSSHPWTFEGHLRKHGRDARATQHVVPRWTLRTLAKTRAGRPCHSACRICSRQHL